MDHYRSVGSPDGRNRHRRDQARILLFVPRLRDVGLAMQEGRSTLGVTRQEDQKEMWMTSQNGWTSGIRHHPSSARNMDASMHW